MAYKYKVTQYDDSGSRILPPRDENSMLKTGAALLALGVVGMIGYISAPGSGNTAGNSAATALASFSSKNGASVDKINYSLKRSLYSAVPYFNAAYDSILKYEHLKNYQGILEPYAPMELHLYDEDRKDVVAYSYKICPSQEPHSPDSCQTGTSSYATINGHSVSSTVNFACSPHTEYSIAISEYDVEGTLLRSQEDKLLCQYVRREIRDLTAEDLTKFMDASAVVYSVSEEDGQARYGSTFHSADYIVSFHHFNAALRDQDHIHEGNGFLLQHLKMTTYFEDSIQAVDRSLSLPYWDFTIDDGEKHTAFNSFAIGEDMFGSMNLPTDLSSGFTYTNDKIVDARIKDGRFADLKAQKASSSDYPSNSWGYLRGPWNMNPSPYVSRYTFDFNQGILLPTCDTHSDILQYDDMMDFFFKIAFGPHATVHTLIGGFYGCDKLLPLVEKGYINSVDDANTICSSWIFYLKEFWRYGYITPKTECSVDENNLENPSCGFECTDESKDLITTRLFAQISKRADITAEGAEEAWQEFICGGDGSKIFSGDHLESASPADPSFWPVHPTLERLLAAKLMAGGFKTDAWATDVVNDYVCDKAMCYSDETGERDYYEDCCYGHFEHDRLMDGAHADRTTFVGMTNAEALAAADPRSMDYSNSYVYDKFEWSHCDTDFEGLLNDLATEMSSSKESEAAAIRNGPSGRKTTQPETKELRLKRVKLNQQK